MRTLAVSLLALLTITAPAAAQDVARLARPSPIAADAAARACCAACDPAFAEPIAQARA